MYRGLKHVLVMPIGTVHSVPTHHVDFLGKMWQEIVTRKQAQRDELIKSATQDINVISAVRKFQGGLEGLEVSQLLNLQLEGKFSAIEITIHHIRRYGSTP